MDTSMWLDIKDGKPVIMSNRGWYIGHEGDGSATNPLVMVSGNFEPKSGVYPNFWVKGTLDKQENGKEVTYGTNLTFMNNFLKIDLLKAGFTLWTHVWNPDIQFGFALKVEWNVLKGEGNFIATNSKDQNKSFSFPGVLAGNTIAEFLQTVFQELAYLPTRIG